jgi:hypothetical protein
LEAIQGSFDEDHAMEPYQFALLGLVDSLFLTLFVLLMAGIWVKAPLLVSGVGGSGRFPDSFVAGVRANVARVME